MRTVRLFTVLCVLIFPMPLRRRCGTARLKHGCVHRALMCGCKVPQFFFNGGERFCRIWTIFAQMFVFAVVGFSKYKSLYLNEREKC